MELAKSRSSLENELINLKAEELKVDEELRQYFGIISGSTNVQQKGSLSFDSFDIASSVRNIEKFGPTFEAMLQDSKKLASQIDDCRLLSERLSGIVRRLDTMQIRAQQTLACTEDIINLKDCKTKIIAAIEENNLSVAVSCLKQVHEIDIKAAKSSDDYDIIKEKEQEVKKLVQNEFSKSISESNINSVMALCPLLQTLGLETEARDNFLDFVEKTVFIAVSVDAASVDGATDEALGYAQSLSNVFNSAFVIIQKYLPMVIQGMESSLGDVYFIRKLHKKVEQEAALVLKRYMIYRRLREIIIAIRGMNMTSTATATSTTAPTPADIHTIMDELALLIQYCCRYSKYLKQICVGAESKIRHRSQQQQEEGEEQLLISASSSTSEAATVANVIVFAGPTEFDKMVDELINKFYMEGERWLMRLGILRALPRSMADMMEQLHHDSNSNGGGDSMMHLDECFFMLQKCGMRAVATNNIQAACAVLHLVSDLLSSELLSQANALLNATVTQVSAVMQEHMNRFKRSIAAAASVDDNGSSSGSDSTGGLSLGFKNALSLASTITGGSSGSTVTIGSNSSGQKGEGGSGGGIQLHEDGGFTLLGNPRSTSQDPWGVTGMIEIFNIIELCARYTDRLSVDITSAGSTVFPATTTTTSAPAANKTTTNNNNNKMKPIVATYTSEFDKLKLCREDFEAAKISFSNVIHKNLLYVLFVFKKI